MRPLLTRMKKECHGKKVFIREFDVADPEDRRIGLKHRLVGTPTFVFLDRQGAEVARLVGEQTEVTLKQALSALRGEPCPGMELMVRTPGGTTSSVEFELPRDDPASRGTSCDTEPSSGNEDASSTLETPLPTSGECGQP
jgi:hypothetical protein